MEHLETRVSLQDKGTNYIVIYNSESDITVEKDGVEWYKFDKKPNTATKHPTKSQAIEIVKIAKKLKLL